MLIRIFFRIFSFPLIQGESDSVINGPSSVVITPEIAFKYFGDKNPTGEILSIQLGEASLDFVVTGIIESPPSNSTIQFSILISTAHFKHVVPERFIQGFNVKGVGTFVTVDPKTNIPLTEKSISDYVAGLSHEQNESFKLQPITDIHLNFRYQDSINKSYFFILSSISFTILLIACINFLTLTIGRSSNRTREVRSVGHQSQVFCAADRLGSL